MEVTVMGQSLDEIRRWISEQYPDANPESEEDCMYVQIELLREMHDSIVATGDAARDLTAAVDRMNVKLTKCLNTLRPRKRGR
jgi:hypothetical protein